MSAMHKRQILWLAVLIQATISGFAQSTAMVNWTNVHQVIDGFGASDAFQGQGGGQGSTTSANQALLFGTGVGQLGYSILRVCVPSGASSPYCSVDCTSVGISCAGPYLGDMQAVVANGVGCSLRPGHLPHNIRQMTAPLVLLTQVLPQAAMRVTRHGLRTSSRAFPRKVYHFTG